MKKIFKLLLLFLILLLSCNEENSTDVQDKILNGNFQLSSSNNYTTSESIGPWLIGDICYSCNSNQLFIPLDAGIMYISNSPLFFDPVVYDGKYFSQSYREDVEFDSLEIKPIIGGVGQWGVSGSTNNNIDEYAIELYTPENIDINEPIPNMAYVSSGGFLLKWDKDENMDSIYIDVNVPIDTTYDDEGNPVYHIWGKIVPDNGEFLIPEDILFSGDTIRVTLSRRLIDSDVNTKINFTFIRIISAMIEYIVE